MANEVKVSGSLQINGGNAVSYNYQSVSSFSADGSAAIANGHTPGTVNAVPGGALVDLSKLVSPGGWAKLQNLDPAGVTLVEFGVWDGTRFMPCLDLLPGEPQIVRLSRNIGNEYGPGTGVIATGDVYQVRTDPSQTNPELSIPVTVEAHNL